MNDYNFGNFVCELREQKGLTQADVARELGVTPAAVSKWENGSSKPRVEVLFRLAEILSVKPEELMAGKRLEETLDAEAVKRINERYEYLCKIDSYNNKHTKTDRIFAWLIDWFLMCLIVSIFPPVFTVIGIVCFILRDVIGGGRSLGKKIMKLDVIDKKTSDKAKVSQKILRNIFFIIVWIDGIVMLTSGQSIGDTVASTAVISTKAPKPADITKINSYEAPEETNPQQKSKRVITIICVSLAVFIATIFIVLDGEKDTPEYQSAYEYFVSSEEFEKSGASENEIVFTSYNHNGTEENATVTYTFTARFKQYPIVCHIENGIFSVCEDCTKFK